MRGKRVEGRGMMRARKYDVAIIAAFVPTYRRSVWNNLGDTSWGQLSARKLPCFDIYLTGLCCDTEGALQMLGTLGWEYHLVIASTDTLCGTDMCKRDDHATKYASARDVGDRSAEEETWFQVSGRSTLNSSKRRLVRELVSHTDWPSVLRPDEVVILARGTSGLVHSSCQLALIFSRDNTCGRGSLCQSARALAGVSTGQF